MTTLRRRGKGKHREQKKREQFIFCLRWRNNVAYSTKYIRLAEWKPEQNLYSSLALITDTNERQWGHNLSFVNVTIMYRFPSLTSYEVKQGHTNTAGITGYREENMFPWQYMSCFYSFQEFPQKFLVFSAPSWRGYLFLSLSVFHRHDEGCIKLAPFDEGNMSRGNMGLSHPPPPQSSKNKTTSQKPAEQT